MPVPVLRLLVSCPFLWGLQLCSVGLQFLRMWSGRQALCTSFCVLFLLIWLVKEDDLKRLCCHRLNVGSCLISLRSGWSVLAQYCLTVMAVKGLLLESLLTGVPGKEPETFCKQTMCSVTKLWLPLTFLFVLLCGSFYQFLPDFTSSGDLAMKQEKNSFKLKPHSLAWRFKFSVEISWNL